MRALMPLMSPTDMSNYRPVRVEIDLAALSQNLNQVKVFSPEAKVMAIVKANGYGHGIIRVAKELSSADGFGVASIDEAIQLRQNGFLHPIVLLEGVFSKEELELVFHHRLEIVIHSFHQLDWLKDLSASKLAHLSIWIKIDTGMHRLGFNPEDLLAVKDELLKLKIKSINWLSHFSSAESSAEITQQQINCFTNLTDTVAGEKSLANSAAIELFPSAHLDWVRPGIMLYGAGIRKQSLPRFKPVMSFYSQITSLKWIDEAETVGYGDTWKAGRKTLIAIVAVGYGDGYPRQAKNGTPVLISEEIVPLVGRVSMDMISVDVTDIAEKVTIGTKVTLWGEGLSVDSVAESADTIGYELLCGITNRVPKIERKND